MAWRELVQPLSFIGYFAVSSWASRGSDTRFWILMFAGIGMYAAGSVDGVNFGWDRAIEHSRQAAILTSPEMPR